MRGTEYVEQELDEIIKGQGFFIYSKKADSLPLIRFKVSEFKPCKNPNQEQSNRMFAIAEARNYTSQCKAMPAFKNTSIVDEQYKDIGLTLKSTNIADFEKHNRAQGKNYYAAKKDPQPYDVKVYARPVSIWKLTCTESGITRSKGIEAYFSIYAPKVKVKGTIRTLAGAMNFTDYDPNCWMLIILSIILILIGVYLILTQGCNQDAHAPKISGFYFTSVMVYYFLVILLWIVNCNWISRHGKAAKADATKQKLLNDMTNNNIFN
jgi:hypothetical protein